MLALIKHQRYAHAHQFKRANRSLRKLKTWRRIDGDPELEEIFARPLSLSRRRVLTQDQRQRGPKVYSLHAPEVECIGKGKAHRPYEFGIKVSVATTAHRSKGGQFVTHIAALPGNPYDGHTLATVIPAMDDMIGNTIERLSPMPVIAATMRQPITGSGSIRQARSVGSHRRSNVSCGGVPPSNQ